MCRARPSFPVQTPSTSQQPAARAASGVASDSKDASGQPPVKRGRSSGAGAAAAAGASSGGAAAPAAAAAAGGAGAAGGEDASTAELLKLRQANEVGARHQRH